MKIKSLRILSGIVVLALAQVACAAMTGGGAKPTTPAEVPVQENTIAPEKTLASGICPAPKLEKASKSPLVEKIVMAKDTQGDNKDPVGPTSTFDSQSTFHAVVAIKDAPAGTSLKAVWYADDTNGVADCGTQIDEYELTTDGTRNIDFSLAPKESWPVGQYRVEIFVNGTLEQNVSFKVK
jgi:hypothetical protein